MAQAATVDEIHASSEIREVEISKLRVDYSYQRDPSEKLVDEISNDWDSVAAELITVSNRGVRKEGDVDGGLWIVNGQHRAKAAQKRGHTKIWARVIDLRKEEDPAALEAGFRLKTNRKLSDRPLERFKAQLRSHDQESEAIVKILSFFGAEINTQPTPDVGINCISTIESLYRLDEDGGLLKDSLGVVKDTWEYVGGKNIKAELLKGICWFVEKHANESDRGRLVSKMKGAGIANIENRARTMGLTMGGAMWVNYYRVIVDLYNEQLRDKNRLQWMLRGKQSLGGSKGR